MARGISIGVSARADEREAAAEAVARALRGLAQPGFALVFSTEPYQGARLAAALCAELGPVPWAGCCMAGVFAGNRLLSQGLVVGVFEGFRVGVGVAPATSKDGRAAGALAATRALEGFPPLPAGVSRALVLLSDALAGNVADVLRGALAVAGSGVIWAGGGSGHALSVGSSAQFAGGRASTDSVVVVALDSPGGMASGICHGFAPYGPATIVTRAEGTVACEFEYETAFAVYQRTAHAHGDEVTREGFAAFAVTHPLGVPRADGAHVIRDPVGVDAAGALRCFAEVPDGSLIRMMQGDRPGLLAAARTATRTARAAVAGPLAGALVFDCVSRSVMLGESFGEELGIFTSELGDAVPVIGCLTYGEVGAMGSGVPQFHNKTSVVLALGA